MSFANDFILHSEFDCVWELPSERNAADYVVRKVRDHDKAGRKTCIRNALTGQALNYSEVDALSRRIASKLNKLGLRDGDTVIYSTHDPAKVHCFMIGVWRANGIVRSSYPEDLGNVLTERIRESNAKFLACDPHLVKDCLEAIAPVPWDVLLVVFGDGEQKWSKNEWTMPISDFFEDDGSELPESVRGRDGVALILPTSGTTGHSKGAIYTHSILLENLVAFEQMPFTDRDGEPTIITSRQTHFVGCVVALSFLTRGRYLLTLPFVTVEALLEAVDKYKARAIIGFPKYLTGLVNSPMAGQYETGSLHYLASAGQVIVPETLAVIKKLRNLKTFINLYGMTEAGLLVTSADWKAAKNGVCKGLDDDRSYTVGKLPPKTSLKVLDIDSGLSVGPNRKGELCFKTSIRIAGYLNNPQEEAETFQDGWVKTGDVGYYDEDGFIYVVDRAKEIFKYYNNHISPSEIESVLLRHPSIAEAVVIGISDPDGGGHIPRAFVVLQAGKSAEEEELILFSENNLPPYKQPKGGIFILPHLPVGKTGKVTRKQFHELPLITPTQQE